MFKMKVVTVAGLALASAGVGWWLFGWQAAETSVSHVTVHRWFGREVRIEVDNNKDGLTDFEVFFPWRTPLRGLADGPCGDPSWTRTREDRNFDGAWDTWVTRPDSSQPCRLMLEADTTGDGQADLSIETTFPDLQEELTQLDRNRGFPNRGLPLSVDAPSP